MKIAGFYETGTMYVKILGVRFGQDKAPIAVLNLGSKYPQEQRGADLSLWFTSCPCSTHSAREKPKSR